MSCDKWAVVKRKQAIGEQRLHKSTWKRWNETRGRHVESTSDATSAIRGRVLKGGAKKRPSNNKRQRHFKSEGVNGRIMQPSNDIFIEKGVADGCRSCKTRVERCSAWHQVKPVLGEEEWAGAPSLHNKCLIWLVGWTNIQCYTWTPCSPDCSLKFPSSSWCSHAV